MNEITLGRSNDGGSPEGQFGFDAQEGADTVDRLERGVGCAAFDPSDIATRNVGARRNLALCQAKTHPGITSHDGERPLETGSRRPV